MTFEEWVKKSAVHWHLAHRDGDWSVDKALRECWKAAQAAVPSSYSQAEIDSWNAQGGSFSEEEIRRSGEWK